MRPFVFLLVVLVGGCGPKFDIVRRGPENLLTQYGQVVVHEPRVGKISVNGRPEPEFTRPMTPAERQTWLLLLGSVREGIVQGLFAARGDLALAQAGAGPAVDVELASVELAHAEGNKTPKTTMRATLRIASPDGVVRDEVRLSTVIEAEVVDPSEVEARRGLRFRRAGFHLGSEAAGYLRYRAGLP